jgi:hypothetical protein
MFIVIVTYVRNNEQDSLDLFRILETQPFSIIFLLQTSVKIILHTHIGKNTKRIAHMST